MKRLHSLLSPLPQSNVDEFLLQRLHADNGDVVVPLSECKRVFAKRVAFCMAEESGQTVSADGETVMSVTELALRKTGLEIVVAWWLLPLLQPGVGAPLAKRVKGKEVAGMIVESSRDDASLWSVCCFLMKMLKAPFLGGVVRDSHLGDLAAGLLQLGFCPDCAKSELGKKARTALRSTLLSIEVDVVLEALLLYVSPAKPEWLKAAAGSLLSQAMARPNSVVALLTLLLEDRSGSKMEEGLFSKAAVLVTTPPRQFSGNPSEFYRSLCNQLISCLRHKSEAVRFCVALCVERLLRNDHVTVFSALFDRVFAPVMAAEASQDELDQAIGDLSLLLVPCGASGGAAAESFWDYFVSKPTLVRRLFLAGCFAVGSISRHGGALANWVSGTLRLPSQDRHRRALVHAMILDAAIPDMGDVVFAFGDNGGLTMSTQATKRDWERESRVLCGTALERAPPGVIGDLFAEVLEVVCTRTSGEPSIGHLLMLELASELMLVPNLLQDVCQVLVVVKSVLGTEHVPEEIAALLIGVLVELIPKFSGLQSHELPLLLDVVPALQHAGSLHHSLFAQASHVIDGINQLKAASLIRKQPPPKDTDDESFDFVLKDLADPMLPVRAHALVGLRKLVLARDANTLDKFDRVLELFSGQMASNDSYLYLGAIQGLAALGDVAAGRTIPILVKDYHNPKLPLETRLKVGEALVTIAQRCGELLPVHAPLLMDCFLRGIQDASADLRASSLANIGACCEILSWSIHAYIHEVLFAVLSVLSSSEKDILVRRAAILVFVLIVRGLGAVKLNQLAKGPLLIQMIERLRFLAQSDADDIVMAQATQALEELSEM
jgi:hypothetical protein